MVLDRLQVDKIKKTGITLLRNDPPMDNWTAAFNGWLPQVDKLPKSNPPHGLQARADYFFLWLDPML